MHEEKTQGVRKTKWLLGRFSLPFVLAGKTWTGLHVCSRHEGNCHLCTRRIHHVSDLLQLLFRPLWRSWIVCRKIREPSFHVPSCLPQFGRSRFSPVEASCLIRQFGPTNLSHRRRPLILVCTGDEEAGPMICLRKRTVHVRTLGPCPVSLRKQDPQFPRLTQRRQSPRECLPATWRNRAHARVRGRRLKRFRRRIDEEE